jgi:hypothetical protein
MLLGLLFSLCACASGPTPPSRPKLPYDTWYVGLAAPKHMEVWVESVDVIDRRGYAYMHVFGGVASYTGKVEGWHKGTGATMPVNNVDLPERIFLRWQSLVEPQSYRIEIKIPQWVRDEMVRPERKLCVLDDEEATHYRNRITLGMAPGGIVKVWAGVGCLGYTEVGRFQAEVEPRGPHQNGTGIYYRAPTPASQAYIDEHGIPYGSW